MRLTRFNSIAIIASIVKMAPSQLNVGLTRTKGNNSSSFAKVLGIVSLMHISLIVSEQVTAVLKMKIVG